MDGFQQIYIYLLFVTRFRLGYLAIHVPSFKVNLSWAVLDGGKGGPYLPSGNSQVAVEVALENLLVRTTREAIEPPGSNCFSREVRTTLCGSVKCVD